ncbi:MAG: hypothetical protein MJB14_14340 [Spirochaetes bacterium]|nr:hypothetical protein [Spirochaetota bacterium]
MNKKNKKRLKKNKRNPSHKKRPATKEKNIIGLKSVSTNIKAGTDNNQNTPPAEKQVVKNKKTTTTQSDNKNPLPLNQMFINSRNQGTKKNGNFNQNKRAKSYRPLRNNRKRNQYYKIQIPQSTICPLCNKNIKNMLTAIYDATENKHVHFDCVVNTLKQKHQLDRKQKLAYIGSGNFAIIEENITNNNNEKMKFQIVTKIPYSQPTKQ